MNTNFLSTIVAVTLLGGAAVHAADAQSPGTPPVHAPAPAAQAALDRAQALDKDKKIGEALAAYISAIEADPEFIKAHEELARFQRDRKGDAIMYHKDQESNVEAAERTVAAKYREWEQRFPGSYGIQYGTAIRLIAAERPEARAVLLKLVMRDPKNAKLYSMLSEDAARRGDKKANIEYLHQAALLEPQNADYAFYYAYELDAELGTEAASREVVKRFPTSERGAQALFWLADRAPTEAKRIEDYEQLRSAFPPEKFGWSADGMRYLFDIYLRVDAPKALALAQSMQKGFASAQTTQSGDEAKRSGEDAKKWADRITLAQTYKEVNDLVAAGKSREALTLLDKLTTETYSPNFAVLIRLKAHVMAQAGQPRPAYDSLVKQQLQAPDDETLAALEATGQQLNMSAAQVEADIKSRLAAQATPAPVFDLQRYDSSGRVSLAKLRGKVVLLTFWFPGCGPCRGEMVHFEKVLGEMHNPDIVYLGVNGLREQDAFVKSFMEKTQFSFTPLMGTKAVTDSDKGYKVRSYPTSFLIDRSGKIAYSKFMVRDEQGEPVLRRMIQSLL